MLINRDAVIICALLLAMLQMAGCATQSPYGGRESPAMTPPPVVTAPETGKVPEPDRSTQPVPGRTVMPEPDVPVSKRIQPNRAAESLLAQAERALSSGAYDSAALWLERAQRASPKAGEVYLAMARLRALQDRWSEAEQLCLKAISLAGSDKAFRAQAEAELNRVRRRRV